MKYKIEGVFEHKNAQDIIFILYTLLENRKDIQFEHLIIEPLEDDSQTNRDQET